MEFLIKDILLSFSDILRSDAQNSDAHVLRARILYLEGDNNKAACHCQEALRCDPDNSKARVLLKVINFINEYNFIYYFNNFFFFSIKFFEEIEST